MRGTGSGRWGFGRFLSPLAGEGGFTLAVVVVAAGITFAQGRDSGLAQRIETMGALRGGGEEEPYEFTKLRTFNRVLFHVTYEYVDPTRVEPRKMFLAALDGIEAAVPEVIVTHEDAADEVEVRIGPAREVFRTDDVDSPWRLAARMYSVARFLDGKFVSNAVRRKLRDVEYAAVNGMLGILDPHTVLLSPEANRNMRTSTQGQFGGIGINIGVRDGFLTVISPIHDTPAWRAGLKPMDRIVQIDDESTINMDLDEAVDRLRGDAGTEVVVWIMRRGWTEPKPFPITRAIIPIDSVKWAMIEGDVGYVHVRQFQRNTVSHLRDALAGLRRQGMRRLIVDLRGDPGGVLEASIEMADLFLRAGTILTAAGNDPRQNTVESASPAGTEPDYPVAILVDGGSASASEIVAGALKNTGRAVVIGTTTFGKGSVQAIHEFPDNSALKITIAQYLTPGDISIQSVGIVPDIETLAMRFDPNDMDLYASPERWSEAELESSLSNERAAVEQKPFRTVRFFVDGTQEKEKEEEEEEEAESLPEREEGPPQAPPGAVLLQPGDEAFEVDFETRLAREILEQAEDSNRRRILDRIGPLLDRVEREEDAKLVEALAGIGVDWQAGAPAAQGYDARLSVSLDRGGEGAVRPGDKVQLRLRVRNDGDRTVYRLRAITESDYHVFDDREFVFGRLGAGEEREWVVERPVPIFAPERVDPVKFVFEADGGARIDPMEFRIPIAGRGHPVFGYRLTISDDLAGNADGRPQRGETLRVRLDVRNLGDASATKPIAIIQNKSGEHIFIRKGREELPEIPPGGWATAVFELEVRADFAEDEFELIASVIDFEVREAVAQRVRIPLAPPPEAPPAEAAGVVEVLAGGARLRSAPDPAGDPAGTIPAGVRVRRTHVWPGWVRVALPDESARIPGRVGWVAEAEVRDARGRPTPNVAFVPDCANVQPRVSFLDGPPLAVRSRDFTLRGVVEDENPILDVYLFVGDDKVFYSNQGDAPDRLRVEFEAPIRLRGGSNVLTIVARETNEVETRRALVIRRDAPDGSTMPTEDEGDAGMGAAL